jgi:hypothetical protein
MFAIDGNACRGAALPCPYVPAGPRERINAAAVACGFSKNRTVPLGGTALLPLRDVVARR